MNYEDQEIHILKLQSLSFSLPSNPTKESILNWWWEIFGPTRIRIEHQFGKKGKKVEEEYETVEEVVEEVVPNKAPKGKKPGKKGWNSIQNNMKL